MVARPLCFVVPAPSRRSRASARVYAAILTGPPCVTLSMVRPGPMVPKLTVNWAGLPREVERTAVICYVVGVEPIGSVSSTKERTPDAPTNTIDPPAPVVERRTS